MISSTKPACKIANATYIHIICDFFWNGWHFKGKTWFVCSLHLPVNRIKLKCLNAQANIESIFLPIVHISYVHAIYRNMDICVTVWLTIICMKMKWCCFSICFNHFLSRFQIYNFFRRDWMIRFYDLKTWILCGYYSSFNKTSWMSISKNVIKKNCCNQHSRFSLIHTFCQFLLKGEKWWIKKNRNSN